MKKIFFLILAFGFTHLKAQGIREFVDSVYNAKMANIEKNVFAKNLISESAMQELISLRLVQNGKYQNVISKILLTNLKNTENNETQSYLINELLNFCISDSLKYCTACENISQNLLEYNVSCFNNNAIDKMKNILTQYNQVQTFNNEFDSYPKGKTVLLAGMLNNRGLNELIKKLRSRVNYKYKTEMQLALARSGDKESIDACLKQFYIKNTKNGKIVDFLDMDKISYIRNKSCVPFYEFLLFDEEAQNKEQYFPGTKPYYDALFFFKKDIVNFPFTVDVKINNLGNQTIDPYIIKVRKWYKLNKHNLQFIKDRF